MYWVRFMGNVLVERYLDPLLAPEPGRRGNYVTLLARAQVHDAVSLRRGGFNLWARLAV